MEVGGLWCKLVQNFPKKAVFSLLFSNLTRCLVLSVSWALLLKLQDAEAVPVWGQSVSCYWILPELHPLPPICYLCGRVKDGSAVSLLHLPSCLIQLLERCLPTSSGTWNKTLDQLFLPYTITSNLSVTRFDGRVKHGLAMCVFVELARRTSGCQTSQSAGLPGSGVTNPLLGSWEVAVLLGGCWRHRAPLWAACTLVWSILPLVSTVWGPQGHCHSQKWGKTQGWEQSQSPTAIMLSAVPCGLSSELARLLQLAHTSPPCPNSDHVPLINNCYAASWLIYCPESVAWCDALIRWHVELLQESQRCFQQHFLKCCAEVAARAPSVCHSNIRNQSLRGRMPLRGCSLWLCTVYLKACSWLGAVLQQTWRLCILVCNKHMDTVHPHLKEKVQSTIC